MKDQEKRYPASAINVGNVEGAGIVIGHESSASVNLHQSSVQYNAAAMLDEFIRLLQIHQQSGADSADLRESAAAARDELTSLSPRWHIVKGLLRGIAAGVAGISALAEVINNIQALIGHLPT
jgi:hypothetical protein